MNHVTIVTLDDCIFTDLSKINHDPYNCTVGIDLGNGYWDEYELIDKDIVDGDYFFSVGNKLNTIYQGKLDFS